MLPILPKTFQTIDSYYTLAKTGRKEEQTLNKIKAKVCTVVLLPFAELASAPFYCLSGAFSVMIFAIKIPLTLISGVILRDSGKLNEAFSEISAIVMTTIRIIACIANIVIAPCLGLISHEMNVNYHKKLDLLGDGKDYFDTKPLDLGKEVFGLPLQIKQLEEVHRLNANPSKGIKPVHLFLFEGDADWGQEELAKAYAKYAGYKFKNYINDKYSSETKKNEIIFMDCLPTTDFEEKLRIADIQKRSTQEGRILIVRANENTVEAREMMSLGAVKISFKGHNDQEKLELIKGTLSQNNEVPKNFDYASVLESCKYSTRREILLAINNMNREILRNSTPITPALLKRHLAETSLRGGGSGSSAESKSSKSLHLDKEIFGLAPQVEQLEEIYQINMNPDRDKAGVKPTRLLVFEGAPENGPEELGKAYAKAIGYEFTTNLHKLENTSKTVFFTDRSKWNYWEINANKEKIKKHSDEERNIVIVRAESNAPEISEMVSMGAEVIKFDPPSEEQILEIIKGQMNKNNETPKDFDYSSIRGSCKNLTRQDTLLAIFHMNREVLSKGVLVTPDLLKNHLSAIVKNKLNQMGLSYRENKNFDGIVGAENLKEELKKLVIQPLCEVLKEPSEKDPLEEELSFPSGVLFYGPPGCGKTHIANTIAGEVQRRSGKVIKFFNVKASELMTQFVNETAIKIREKFEFLAKEAPCILFIDEFEVLAKDRSIRNTHNEDHKAVTALLTALDEAAKNKILVIAATNRPEDIDEGIKRDGRFSIHLEFTVPDKQMRQDLFKKHLTPQEGKNQLAKNDINYEELAENCEGLSCASIIECVKKAKAWRWGEPKDLETGKLPLITQDILMKYINEIKMQKDRAAAKKKTYENPPVDTETLVKLLTKAPLK